MHRVGWTTASALGDVTRTVPCPAQKRAKRKRIGLNIYAVGITSLQCSWPPCVDRFTSRPPVAPPSISFAMCAICTSGNHDHHHQPPAFQHTGRMHTPPANLLPSAPPPAYCLPTRHVSAAVHHLCALQIWGGCELSVSGQRSAPVVDSSVVRRTLRRWASVPVQRKVSAWLVMD